MNNLHFAVVVGISRYPGVSDLNAPVKDACDFRDWLLTEGGVPPGNLQVLTSPGTAVPFASPFDGRPIKREIDHALDAINKQAQAVMGPAGVGRERSRLYLYVAGHGIMPNGGEAALLLADAERGRYENFELRSYVEWYAKAGIFGEVVVFADCCRNVLPQVPKSVVPFDDPAQFGSKVFSLVGYAASPDNPSYESVEESIPPDLRRGYFTTSLITGLRGAAPVDRDYGCITSTTLARYVSIAVKEATVADRKRYPQEVRMAEEPGHAILFGVPAQSGSGSEAALESTAFDVTIRFPAGWAAPVELWHNDKRERYEGAPADWALSLPFGAYAVFRAGTWDPVSPDATFTVSGAKNVQL